MKWVIDMHFCDKSNRDYSVVILRKEIETNLIPCIGFDYQDSAWKRERAVRHVSMIPDEGCYFVHFGEETCASEEDCLRLADMYKRHGWKSLSEIRP